MKQDLVAGGVGAVLLGAVVAFAVLPGGGAEAEQPEEPSAAEVAQQQADDLGCRGARLGLARHPLTDVLDMIAQATEFERQRGDGGLVFDDWYEPDPADETLTGIATELSAAGQVPGVSEGFFDADLAVVEAATRLLRATDGSTLIDPDAIDDARLDLVEAVADLEETCGAR